jgi:hypothetical protein
MFYLLKHHLLLILVIFKLKCNNLIFNEIMILNASYVCLHAFSLHRESPDPDPGRRTAHFWGGFVRIAARLVHLNSPVHGKDTLYLHAVSRIKASLHHMVELKLEGIHVIWEFSDVFPNDLPGMPPKRVMEFKMEL